MHWNTLSCPYRSIRQCSPNRNNIPAITLHIHIEVRLRRNLFLYVDGAARSRSRGLSTSHVEIERKCIEVDLLLCVLRQHFIHIPQEEVHENLHGIVSPILPCYRSPSLHRPFSIGSYSNTAMTPNRAIASAHIPLPSPPPRSSHSQSFRHIFPQPSQSSANRSPPAIVAPPAVHHSASLPFQIRSWQPWPHSRRPVAIA